MNETKSNNIPKKYFLHLFIVVSLPVLFIRMWEVGQDKRNINVGRSNTYEGKTIPSGQKVTMQQAKSFIINRFNNINQDLISSKTTSFNGTRMYVFLSRSLTEEDVWCISTISENALEVLATDCGYYKNKEAQWNSF